ncbi:MAG: RecQ family ATP-dependent DNA helicase [Syntrophomonas sp.]|nr:RecQ family ATP-dependent DNA helicase [Syntrophomonas sp.]
MRRRAEALLQSMLGIDARFRDGQWEAIESVVVHKDRTLVVQRTGWGKSMVYFIATRLLRDMGVGITVLVSPLLSLMRNQIEMAERIGIHAATINSDNPKQWDEIEVALKNNEFDILMISPERLASPRFMVLLAELQSSVGMLVVDEAHCISDWGHDFRPDYRRIVGIIEQLPAGMPVLATTATANDRVVEDIREQLGKSLNIIRGPLARESLKIQTIILKDQAERLAWLAENIPQIPGSGIIYCLTTADCRRVANWLHTCGINALEYHSKISPEDAVTREQLLLHNEVKALASTIKLGMGFDKPDLGFVIHFNRPGSLVAYYQQIGRAGRSLEEAYAILLSGREDDEIQDYFINQAFPSSEEMLRVCSLLESADSGLSINEILQRINMAKGRVEKCLKIMEIESVAFKETSKYYRSANPWAIDEHRMQRVTDLRQFELRKMQEFVETEQCYMEMVTNQLDDPNASKCNRCANCAGSFFPSTVNDQLLKQATHYLKRDILVIEPRKQWPPNGIGSFRGRIEESMQNQPGRALCMYGDAGWGQLVRRGKYQDVRFSDELVDAVVNMINDVWNPEPRPTWVTAIPSNRRPELVADLAERIANRLGIPFEPVLSKTADNPEQKRMANSNQQAANVLNVFDARENCPSGPVLLVDDMVDSRWTLTICGWLLQTYGSGPVFPLALAATWAGGDDA